MGCSSRAGQMGWVRCGMSMPLFLVNPFSAFLTIPAKSAYEAVPTRLQELGAKVEYPINILDGAALKCGDDSLVTAACKPSFIKRLASGNVTLIASRCGIS